MGNQQSKPDDTFKVTGNRSIPPKQPEEKYSPLTDEDLKLVSGKEEELVFGIASRPNKSL